MTIWPTRSAWFCQIVIPANAGLRRQDAGANIREADGPQGNLRTQVVIQRLEHSHKELGPGARRDDEQNG
ncbi:hypothetical protein GCM10009105_02390 [Dokdonella soli]|uniref:Uncharacterized protein n=1 Tax=Dokdonella soli TaxID=529810 RepID=A0ABP3THV2_9GAMM